MKINKVILLVSGGAVAALMLVVSGFLLFRGIGQFSDAERRLKDAVELLKTYYWKNPFPTSKNIVLEQENVRILKEWFGRLMEDLRKDQVEPDRTKSPSKFMKLLSEKKNKLTELASLNGTVLPENFAFGFDRYSAEGIPPAPDDVPRLTQQLMIIENLFGVFCQEDAKQIISIRRDEFEDPATPGGPGGPRGRRRRDSREKVTTSTRPVTVGNAGIMGKDDLYARLHFVFDFKAKESSVLNILNRLTCHGMFVVITSLKFEKEGIEVVKIVPRGAEIAQGSGEESTAMQKDVKDVIPPRIERMMCGLELETPMKVKMEMDVYRFRKE